MASSHAAQPFRQRQQALALRIEHVFLQAEYFLDREPVDRRVGNSAIHCRTVATGRRSNSGLNHEVLLPLGDEELSRWRAR